MEVDAQLKHAERDNEVCLLFFCFVLLLSSTLILEQMIYHERVPNEGQLSVIAPVDIATPDAYQRPTDAKDILASLLSLKVHLAASEFSEIAANLVRDAEKRVSPFDGVAFLLYVLHLIKLFLSSSLFLS